jgi:hypothetical protein
MADDDVLERVRRELHRDKLSRVDDVQLWGKRYVPKVHIDFLESALERTRALQRLFLGAD